MAEKLGEAVLELRTDDSALYAGMAKAKAGAQDLDRSFASGKNAEVARRPDVFDQGDGRRRLGNGGAGAAVGAPRWAGAGATTATVAVNGLGHGSALATRELLVLMREASRGNFTRMAGRRRS
jgi:hypothetical protein